jgi:HK97 family phage major capsid protein
MGKKFILINGQKAYIEEEPGDEPKPTETPAPEADLQKEAEEAAKAIKKELGLDELKDVFQKASKVLEQPENSKLKEILHGKDLISQKDQLTKEEKIVGFFHGLVSKNDAVVKALSEGTAADGGYLFPDEFMAELIKALTEPPHARALVRVVTMRRDIMKIPTLLNRPKVYWTAENASKTTTTAAFGEATLTARKAAAILYASDELIEDSTEIDVVRLIIDLFAEAIGIEEDRVILRGNGTTEPTGIVTARAAGTIASVSCSGNLSFDNIINLIYALKPQYRAGASFLVHPTNVKELRLLKDSQNRYIWQDAVAPGQPATIYGYPVHEFYDMPESEIEFGNWKLCYWLGDRKRMAVKVSNDTETAFTKDQTAIRVVMRLAGNVVLGDAAKGLISIP